MKVVQLEDEKSEIELPGFKWEQWGEVTRYSKYATKTISFTKVFPFEFVEGYIGIQKEDYNRVVKIMKQRKAFHYEDYWKLTNLVKPDFEYSKGSSQAGNHFVYFGQIAKDQPAFEHHGVGIILWANGTLYQGQFWEGYRHGRGRYIYPSGACYQGEFENNFRTGKGIYYSADGKIKHKGKFKDNEFIGE